eukprot:36336-Rhodomonas_salina.2
MEDVVSETLQSADWSFRCGLRGRQKEGVSKEKLKEMGITAAPEFYKVRERVKRHHTSIEHHQSACPVP